MSFRRACALGLLCFTSSAFSEQIIVKDDVDLTLADMVSELTGDGLVITSPVFSGVNMQAGTFSGYSFLFGDGFDSGIVLGTGNVVDAVAAVNNADNTGTIASGAAFPGTLVNDPDLGSVYDPVKVSFDVTPSFDTLILDFVFGSEEYNEFVNAGFNDNMRILVNGANCALTPDGQVFSIDAVNDRANFPPAAGVSGPSSNPTLFVNNDPGLNFGETPVTPPFATQIDGFTKTISCRASVTPGVANTVVIGIADDGDGTYDSWVFFRARSLRAEPGFDFGDAPDDGGSNNYPTLLVNNGARHFVREGVFLGSLPTGDTNGFVEGTDDSTNASDDSNDDGVVTFTNLVDTDTSYSISVNATSINGKGATVIAWIDFDLSGTFDADEVSTTAALAAGENNKTVALNWANLNSSGPDVNEGTSYARVRIINSDETIGASDFNGSFNSGEVEDYTFEISGTTDNEDPVVTINTLDTAAIANQSTYIVSGTCTAGDDNVAVSITDASPASQSVLCDGGGNWTATFDVSGVANGANQVIVSASQQDAQSNSGSAGPSLADKDALRPSVDIQNVPSDTNAAFTATFEFQRRCYGICTC